MEAKKSELPLTHRLLKTTIRNSAARSTGRLEINRHRTRDAAPTYSAVVSSSVTGVTVSLSSFAGGDN